MVFLFLPGYTLLHLFLFRSAWSYLAALCVGVSWVVLASRGDKGSAGSSLNIYFAVFITVDGRITRPWMGGWVLYIRTAMAHSVCSSAVAVAALPWFCLCVHCVAVVSFRSNNHHNSHPVFTRVMVALFASCSCSCLFAYISMFTVVTPRPSLSIRVHMLGHPTTVARQTEAGAALAPA